MTVIGTVRFSRFEMGRKLYSRLRECRVETGRFSVRVPRLLALAWAARGARPVRIELRASAPFSEGAR